MLNRLNALFSQFNNDDLRLNDTTTTTTTKPAPKKSADKLKIEALELEILELKKELSKYKPKAIKVVRN